MSNPAAFIRCLHASWRECERMRRRGAPAAAIGLAFHRALGEMFGRDRDDVMRTQVSETPRQ